MPIFYRNQQIGTRDVLISLWTIKFPVEIKAISVLDNSHFAQAINYLEAYNLEIGLLINFGETSFKIQKA